jgi:hypothetical protein
LVACRRADLVALLQTDLDIGPADFGTVTIPRSMTDQEGAGAVAPITSEPCGT